MSTSNPKLRGLEKLEIGTESAFMVAPAAYSYLRTAEPTGRDGLMWKAIEDTHPRVGITQVSRILGPRTGKLGLKLQMPGFSSTVPIAAPTNTSHPFAQLFAWAFGLLQSGGFAGAVDTTGTTTSVLKVPNLSSFAIGQAIAWATQNYGYQVGWAINNDATPVPDEITLLQTAVAVPFPVAPATLFGASVVAMTTGRDNFSAGVREGLSFRLSGHESDDQLVLNGCMPTSAKLNFKIGEPVMVDIDIGVAHWSEVGSGGAPTSGTWTHPQPEALMGAWVSFGTSAATTYRIGDAEFDLGLDVVPVPDPTRASGIGGWYVKGRRPRMTFNVYRSYAAEVTDWGAQTSKAFVFTFGTQAGKMFSLAMKNARIVEYPSSADENGAVVSKIVLEAQNYTGDTGNGGADLVDKDCHFAWL